MDEHGLGDGSHHGRSCFFGLEMRWVVGYKTLVYLSWKYFGRGWGDVGHV